MARSSLFTALLATCAIGIGAAAAQSYPTRQIQLVVPFPAGGNTDLMARALQPELAKALGQPVVVFNKGGAAGTLGNIDVFQARPDGYTVGLSPNNPLTGQPHVQKLPYSLDSFRYICLIYDTPYVLIGGPKAPFKTMQEFITYTKAKPDNLIYGTPGPGSTNHLVMLAVLGAIKGDGVHVPFQGAGPMSQALLGGTIMAFTETPSVAKASNLPILASLTKQRQASIPDVPTAAELGYPAEGFTAGGLIVPEKTPDAVVQALEKACQQASASSEFKATIERLNGVPRYLPGAEFKAMFQQDSVRNAGAVKAAGLGPK
jgi:tripartite-type tricarboxylate transporter receptor subunit TctC